jgi:magnesium transporter
LYRDGKLEQENFPAQDLTGHLDDPGAIVWLDLARPTADDLVDLRQQLGLHELAIEDAVAEHQRPKVDHYQGHALVIAYAIEPNPKNGALHHHELAIFVTERALITVRKDPEFDIDKVVERWDRQSELADSGVSFLLYGVLDYIVDGYLDTLQVLDDQVETLEDDLFADRPTSTNMQRRSLRLHKSLGQLRRKVSPMRDVLGPLMRRESKIFNEQMLPYFQDVLDHVLFASEQVESLRDLSATIRDTQLNMQGNRMNLVMKKVTSWAAIIAVPTAITGFYGQNVPIPGIDNTFSFWLSSVVIVLTSVGLYAAFKRRDWL